MSFTIGGLDGSCVD